LKIPYIFHFLKEKIESGEFQYTENKLLEINFQNARCARDTNLNMYVHKKKSNGKVDMVVSLINAIYLLQQDIIFGGDVSCDIQVCR
jgi:phage terminase large subunit-like protein